jgi:hypothetical protein
VTASVEASATGTIILVSFETLPPPAGLMMSPAPTDEEAAAIIAATEALWPKPIVLLSSADTAPSRSWRFSGRWWSVPAPARRERPYR